MAAMSANENENSGAGWKPPYEEMKISINQ
jgi:hypothetical protein